MSREKHIGMPLHIALLELEHCVLLDLYDPKLKDKTQKRIIKRIKNVRSKLDELNELYKK